MTSSSDIRLPTVLVLASGRGERFLASGGTTHKLSALLAGKPVLEHVLDAVRASSLPWHLEDAGHPGLGDSISAAVRATPQAHGWLILPGDLPLIQGETLRLLAGSLVSSSVGLGPRYQVVIPVCKGQRGHPVGFSATCRDALLNLSGVRGAAPVIAAYQAIKIAVSDVGTVTDIDTVEDLRRAQALMDSASS